MPKQLLEINKFFNGTITTPDTSDTPEESASYSLNIDAVIKDGSLQSVPKNRIKYIYNSSGTAGGEEIDADKIALIRSDGKMDGVYWDKGNSKIHFISEIDKNSTLSGVNIATTTSTLDIPGDFSTGSGVSISVPSGNSLSDIAMEPHSKEIHMGFGMGSNATPKWIGYTNHSQFGNKISSAIVEDAQVKYPSSLPFLYKTVTVSGSTYGISLGGTRIWKINTDTGAHVNNSDKGTFENLQSICSDGTNLYVLDRYTTSSYKDRIIKVETSALSTKNKVMGLPTTYPGPNDSQYTDIEFTGSGGTAKVWVAAHNNNRTRDNAAGTYLWNFSVPNDAVSTVSLDARMPKTSGGSNATVGSWVEISIESDVTDVEVTASDFTATTNHIYETFPRSLVKHPDDSSSVYWLHRYQDYSANPSDGRWDRLWMNAKASTTSNSGTGEANWASKVAEHCEIMTLCLGKIAYNHTSNNAVPLMHVDYPNSSDGNSSSSLGDSATQNNVAVNIDSIGLDSDKKVHMSLGSTLHRYSTVPDHTFTLADSTSSSANKVNLGSKTATSYNVTPSGQTARTGVNVNIGHQITGGNVAILRKTGTSGIDKAAKAYAANAAQTHVLDYSAVSVAIAQGSTNTGSLQAGFNYFYKLTFLFDGYQETNLCTEVFTDNQSTSDGEKNKEITLTISNIGQIPRRASDVLIYRAESTTETATVPDSLFRLVKQIPLDTVWTTSTDGTTGVTSATLMHEDNGFKGPSYEANSELPEDLEFTMPNYGMSAQINNYHFVGKCSHEKITDASTYVFRSKVGKFDTFDWLLDFVKLPTVPTALMAFNGRIWAFDDANTYKIEPNNMFIEDIFEGVGCLNDDAIVSTDFGMFFADNKNIYHLTSGIAEPIGEAIVRGSDASGTGNDVTSWQNRDRSYHTRAVYDPTRRSVYFSFKGTDGKYYVWGWNIPRKRWDLFSFDDSATTVEPKGVCTLDSGEILWSGKITDSSCDTTNNDATVTMTSTSNIRVGMNVTGTGIPANTTVSSITNATTFELSKNATASNDNTPLSFTNLFHFIGNASNYRHWTWVSKNLTMGNDTQEKKIKDILSTDRIKVEKTVDGSFPSSGSQLANNISTSRGTYRMKNINSKTTSLRVRLDSNSESDSCSAFSILFRSKKAR